MSKTIYKDDFILPYRFVSSYLWYSEYYQRYVLPTQKDYRRNQITLDERIN